MSSDRELVERWSSGDETAGRQLFDRYFEPLYRFFCNKVHDAVEDLIQETFLACVEGRARFRHDASFRTYLFSVARNRLYKHWRRRSRKEGNIDFGLTSVEDMGISPSSVAAKLQEMDVLLQCIRTIPADLQVVLELYYWEDMPTPEIAEVLEIPDGTARSRLRRAREAVAAAVQQRGPSARGLDVGDDGLKQWATAVREIVGLAASQRVRAG